MPRFLVSPIKNQTAAPNITIKSGTIRKAQAFGSSPNAKYEESQLPRGRRPLPVGLVSACTAPHLPSWPSIAGPTLPGHSPWEQKREKRVCSRHPGAREPVRAGSRVPFGFLGAACGYSIGGNK